ncbi:MAG: hypothetical protein GY928_16480 [Colwellia sp.]|nr:hypothetical protein [Colwellia sp.]
MPKALTEKEESFAQAYVLNKNDSMQGYKNSLYSQKLSPENMSTQAYKLLQKPHISRRIKELQEVASKVAEKKFSISVEWRLKALRDIYDAGMGEYTDAQENKRKESLQAARGAIDTMNTMLGVSEESEEIIKPIPIGVVDAS